MARDGVKRAIPHIIVLAVLVFILLVILTRFKWVHCSQIPQWCDIYCSIFGRSRIALVYGEEGIGDHQLFFNQVRALRPATIIELFPLSAVSYGLLKDYELVILMRMRTITFAQAQAIKRYLEAGGSALWVGDAASNFTLSEAEVAEALVRNETSPGYYERLLRLVNETRGFGELSNYVMASFQRTETVRAQLVPVKWDHSILRGYAAIGYNISLPEMSLAIVAERPGFVTKIAVLRIGEKSYPGIFETRFVGRIIYVAFPLERLVKDLKMTWLLRNIFDYLVTC